MSLEPQKKLPIKVISETQDTRFKIKKVDPEHYIIKRLNQRITYLEVKVDQQEAWITMLLDKLLHMTKSQVH